MEPIEIGERIRSYREQLGITREQLAAGKISSSLIKYIEQGKRKLTPIRAAIIAANLNEVAKRKNIQFKISANDLLISNTDYASKICKSKILQNKNTEFYFEEYLDILKTAELYNLDDIKLEIYQIFSCYYFSKDANLSILYLKKELCLCIHQKSINTISGVLNKLGACYYSLGKYQLAIQYFNHCYYYIDYFCDNNSDLKIKVLYNLALCYKKQSRYSEALYYLKYFFSLTNVENALFNLALILKANIFLEQKKYELALNIYTYIANQTIDYSYIIQHNMALAFNKLNRFDESINYLTKSINNQISSPSLDTTFSLIDMADTYGKENMKRESIVFYEYALDNSLKFKQYNELFLCYKSLFKLYEDLDKHDKAKNLYNHLKHLASNKNLSEESKNTITSLLEAKIKFA